MNNIPTYEHVDLCRSVNRQTIKVRGTPWQRWNESDTGKWSRDELGRPRRLFGVPGNQSFDPDHTTFPAETSVENAAAQETFPTKSSRKQREDATHPRALVITGTVAPASIFLVLSPIIPAKPPNSHSNTHRGPARNTRRRALQCQKRDGLGRSISRHRAHH